jgi:hypothetical protein
MRATKVLGLKDYYYYPTCKRSCEQKRELCELTVVCLSCLWSRVPGLRYRLPQLLY